MTPELKRIIEHTLRSVYDINVVIAYNNNEILVQGNMNHIDELKAHIFIFGFLHGWNEHNNLKENDKIKLYDPGKIG